MGLPNINGWLADAPNESVITYMFLILAALFTCFMNNIVVRPGDANRPGLVQVLEDVKLTY